MIRIDTRRRTPHDPRYEITTTVHTETCHRNTATPHPDRHRDNIMGNNNILQTLDHRGPVTYPILEDIVLRIYWLDFPITVTGPTRHSLLTPSSQTWRACLGILPFGRKSPVCAGNRSLIPVSPTAGPLDESLSLGSRSSPRGLLRPPHPLPARRPSFRP